MRVAAGQVSAVLDDETVILSMRDGRYYGVEGAGSRIWGWMAEPVTLGALAARVVAAYEVGEAQAFDDLVALVTELEGLGLVERDADAPDD